MPRSVEWSGYGSRMPGEDFHFEYSGVVFVADEPLRGVREASPSEQAIVIRSKPPSVPWTDLAMSGDLGRHEGALVGRSEGEARFRFDGAEIEVGWVDGLTATRRTQILLDWIIPYILSDRGQHVLHATAVEIAGAAWGFCGRSGLGKSTLAVACAQRGHKLLADDTFVLDEARSTLWPSHPTARLKSDSLQAVTDKASDGSGEKTVIGDGDLLFADHPVRLGGVFLLLNDAEFEIAAAAASDIPTLLEQTYVLPGAGIAAALDGSAQLIEAGRVHRLYYPRKFDELPTVVERIVAFAHANKDGSL